MLIHVEKRSWLMMRLCDGRTASRCLAFTHASEQDSPKSCSGIPCQSFIRVYLWMRLCTTKRSGGTDLFEFPVKEPYIS